MIRHLAFRPRFTGTVIAALMAAQAVRAQELPPPPPLPVLLTQAAEPTPIAPVLPDLNLPAADLPPADANFAVPEGDVEAFARGPVHEAFADVYELDPAPNELVMTAPPAAVDELPPETAPSGDNVQWISGYWAWDVEGKDYLWVSGVWRDVPPGRRWVPGYWAEVTGGYQWVSGFWADARASELTYVPPPPESLEVGPNIPAPSEDHIWVPGSWSYVNANYSWSPGYYTVCQPNYMWVPAQYVWTPRGCVHVPGYMDYRFANRGVCFSPVRFRRPLVGYGFGRPAWYRPRYSIGMSGFLIHLFVRPRCRTFYYGDYYGNQYAGFGYSPWYRRTSLNRRCYDPAFSFYRWDSHRHGQNFVNNIDTWHRRYESNVDLRPPRLVSDHTAFLARHQGDRAAQLAVTTQRFDEVVARRSDLNFHRVEAKELTVAREAHRANRDLEVVRRQTERDPKIGTIVDLKPGTVRDRVDAVTGDKGRPDKGDLANREERVERTRPERLKLNELPVPLREKAEESVVRAEKLREQAHVPNPNRDEIRSRVESIREQRSGREGEMNTDKPGRGSVVGENGDRNLPSNVETPRQKLEDRRSARDNEPKGLPEARPALPGDKGSEPRNSQLDELRQRAEAHRASRDVQVGNDSGAPRSMERGSAPDLKSGRGSEPSPAQIRAQEIRQQTEVRRQEREVQREAPAPINRTPIDRTPVERAPRQIEQRNPVERMPIERAPVERAPRQIERAPVERAPVERAPRQIERAPVERAPRQVERAPVERAPRQVERAPVERAPRSERAPSGGRRGKD
jgi:hypothetical protein